MSLDHHDAEFEGGAAEAMQEANLDYMHEHSSSEDEEERPRRMRKLSDRGEQLNPADHLTKNTPYIPLMEPFSDSDDEMLDTTLPQLHAGKDLQGIPWHNTQWTREGYREHRDQIYRSYYNLEAQVQAAATAIQTEATLTQEILDPKELLFRFHRNWRRPRSTIVHFQLRNLLWATTSHDVYLVHEKTVVHWNNIARDPPDVIMDVSGLGPSSTAPGGIGPAQLCTLCASHGLVAAGGFGGELIVRQIGSTQNYSCSRRITNSDNGITNAIYIHQSSSGATQIVCSNNDAAVRIYDCTTFTQFSQLNLPWAVNYSTPQPEDKGSLLCVVGDDPVALLYDMKTEQPVMRLEGHYDYSFAAAWHPDGNIVATGNQDLCTRVFDIRMPGRSIVLLKAHIGAVRSVRFSSDGRYMAVAEPADYITIYDVKSGYVKKQTIDLFGEIAGVSFSPDGQRLFASVSDLQYSSVLQFDTPVVLDLYD